MRKLFFLLLLSAGLASCDTAHRLLVDDHQEKRITCECGTIVIMGASIINDYISVIFEGSFTVNPNSLIIKKNTKTIQANLYLNGNPIDSHKPFAVRDKDKLSIHISDILPMHLGKTGILNLCPSNFIMCNEKPLITDTIRFTYKSK
ncbi:MAG: hypothetical protein IKR18_04110 [Bacteroidaceae bacterium]|nr:hypothetical protein [Bacteroidaceae bacterium]